VIINICNAPMLIFAYSRIVGTTVFGIVKLKNTIRSGIR